MHVRQLPSAKGNSTQHYANLNHYSSEKNRTYHRSSVDMAGCWWEIDEDIYNYFMEMLPPVYRPYGFSMSEKLTDNIAAYFFHTDGAFYCAYVDFNEINAAALAAEWPHTFSRIAETAEFAERYAALAIEYRDKIGSEPVGMLGPSYADLVQMYMHGARHYAAIAMHYRLTLTD